MYTNKKPSVLRIAAPPRPSRPPRLKHFFGQPPQTFGHLHISSQTLRHFNNPPAVTLCYSLLHLKNSSPPLTALASTSHFAHFAHFQIRENPSKTADCSLCSLFFRLNFPFAHSRNQKNLSPFPHFATFFATQNIVSAGLPIGALK